MIPPNYDSCNLGLQLYIHIYYPDAEITYRLAFCRTDFLTCIHVYVNIHLNADEITFIYSALNI